MKTTVEEVVRAIARRVVDHAARESALLYPNPAWYIADSPADFLDFVAEVSGVPATQVHAWADERYDEKGTPSREL